jgi:hypothetical protein
MAIELALGKEDQTLYGGPEWVTFDITGLDDIPLDKLDAFERQLMSMWGIGFPRLVAEEMPENTLRARRALVWLARKFADIKTPDLKEFEINVRRVRVREVKPAGDGDPPAQDSSNTSSEEKASEKASSRSSRGSGKTPATNSQPEKSGS